MRDSSSSTFLTQAGEGLILGAEVIHLGESNFEGVGLVDASIRMVETAVESVSAVGVAGSLVVVTGEVVHLSVMDGGGVHGDLGVSHSDEEEDGKDLNGN